MRALLVACALLLPGCAAGPLTGVRPAPADASPRIEAVDWEWVETVTPVETVTVPDPSLYTLRIDGARAALRADCNRATAMVEVSPPRELAFKTPAMTRAMCPPGSLSERYVKDVTRTTTYFFRDGALYLEMPVDSGTLRFRRVGER